jgi:hypothetical protein
MKADATTATWVRGSGSRLVGAPRRLAHLLKIQFWRLPYILGFTSLWPRSFIAYTPDRYAENADKVIQRTGLSLFKDVSGFVQGNRANNAGDLARFYLFNLIFEQMKKEGLTGDLAELGVYKGNTAVLLANVARALDKTLYLFDTFQGFSGADLQGIDADKALEFQDTSIDAVKSLVGNERTRYIAGYFPASATAMPDDVCFCLVHLDCDLYAPMKSGLEYFYPRLVPGGFLILHDYSSLYWDGAEKAIDEFLADKPERVIPVPDKSGTVVVRKIHRAA